MIEVGSDQANIVSSYFLVTGLEMILAASHTTTPSLHWNDIDPAKEKIDGVPNDWGQLNPLDEAAFIINRKIYCRNGRSILTMANKKTVKRRRLKKRTPPPFEQRDFPKEMIKRLEQIVAISGRRNGQVFEDFVYLSEATLTALPDQLKAVGTTGRFAEDPPETAETFARVRAHYERDWLGADRSRQIWRNFGEAFALLLEATAPGLWGEPNSLNLAGISGPDILGYIFQTWASPPAGRKWHAQVLTPWPVAVLLSAMTIGLDGERQIHDRLKQALCHPDNLLGQAVLLAGLVIPEDQPEVARDHFFNRVIPAALDFYEPLTVYEPAIGTGILVMAAASVLPAWAVRLSLVKFVGGDIDPLMVAASRTSTMLYGLNGYALQLEAAAAEALSARQQRLDRSPPADIQSPGQILQAVCQNGRPPPVVTGEEPTFEQMFRAAGRVPLA